MAMGKKPAARQPSPHPETLQYVGHGHGRGRAIVAGVYRNLDGLAQHFKHLAPAFRDGKGGEVGMSEALVPVVDRPEIDPASMVVGPFPLPGGVLVVDRA